MLTWMLYGYGVIFAVLLCICLRRRNRFTLKKLILLLCYTVFLSAGWTVFLYGVARHEWGEVMFNGQLLPSWILEWQM